MNDFIQITFTDIQSEQQELLIAQLSEAGYEGFEEGENELKAFIATKDFEKALLEKLVHKYQLSYKEEHIPSQNWNAVWESNFQPVVVDDFVAIRADFHEPISNVQHEIIITPKMSFGTGHHATTYMMMQQMREIDFAGKSVLDFGTGTGVLAILAEKLGAKSVMAIDNDDWSIENAKENFQKNNCSFVEILKAGSAEMNNRFDVVLANINKNVILDNLYHIKKQLEQGGILLLSGLLKTDEPAILKKANQLELQFKNKEELNNWLCLRLSEK